MLGNGSVRKSRLWLSPFHYSDTPLGSLFFVHFPILSSVFSTSFTVYECIRVFHVLKKQLHYYLVLCWATRIFCFCRSIFFLTARKHTLQNFICASTLSHVIDLSLLPLLSPLTARSTMSFSDGEHVPEQPRYITFPEIEHGTLRDGELVLNRWSSTLTADHDFPGAQVCHSTYSDPQCCHIRDIKLVIRNNDFLKNHNADKIPGHAVCCGCT
jgi:hypothetical protein